jgi:type IV secretory pathway TraG/TraD family ATPase VirD4
VLGRARENKFVSRLEEGRGVILVVQLGALLTKRAAYTAAKVILSTVQAFVGRRFASNELLDPPLAVYLDEAQSVLYQGVEELFAKAGGANVYLSGFCQSINQLFSEITEERGRTVLDNCNTKLFLRVADADTALYVSEHLGEQEVFLPIIGMGTHNISLRDDIQERVRPTEILNLAPREFFLLAPSGTYRGKTLDVGPAAIEIEFPRVQEAWA